MNPGALLTAQVSAISRMLTTLVSRDGLFDPPLLQGKRIFRTGPYSCWNRRPREWSDWEAWRRQVELAETFRVGPRGARETMAEADAGLAGWVRGHRYLQPVEVDKGECSMALLLLWEVEHGGPFPTVGTDRASALAGFTKRLARRVALDEELKEWLVTKDVQRPIAPGMPEVHHTRWSVRVCQPPVGEPQGWYAEFVGRWRSYLGSLTQPVGRNIVPAVQTEEVPTSSNPACPTSPGPAFASRAGRRRPRSVEADTGPPARRRAQPPPRPLPGDLSPRGPHSAPGSQAPQEVAAAAATSSRQRPRSPTSTAPQRPTKRQCDVRQWLRPRQPQEPVPATTPPPHTSPAGSPEHGRAAQGPAT